MRQVCAILVALGIVSDASAVVKRWEEPAVDSQQSAALFVGVREFKSDKTIMPVPYAVDDAVDLAFEIAIDGNPILVPPTRVVLALSGQPQKPRSKENLQKLLAAGALQTTAQQSDILQWLEKQAMSVGRNGILIVTFATHGMNESGRQYLLTEGSLVQHIETSLTEETIRDVVSRHVSRSLILIDACRERLTRDTRAGVKDPRSAFRRLMNRLDGQVVISAATDSGYAYDDEERRNGIFTASIIDGLRCGATKDSHGFVTVDRLHSYVESAVLKWVQDNRDPRATRATQISCEGQTKKMPLSICIKSTAAASHSPRD